MAGEVWSEKFRKNKCVPGQPPGTHRSWSSCPRPPPLSGGRRFWPDSAHEARRICLKRAADREIASCAVASGPFLLHERDGGGGRNARATSTRLRAFPECPPAIHPRESPAAAGSAAIIRRAQERLTFSMKPLCSSLLRGATGNNLWLVQKLWTMRLPCGKTRKTKH
jgi:hypothetical protein